MLRSLPRSNMAKTPAASFKKAFRGESRLTPPVSAALALTAQPGRRLTPAQMNFNRLVANVERLRAKLEEETRRLDDVLEKFVREIHPCLQRLTGVRADVVRAMAPFLADRRIKGVRDRRSLRELLGHHLDCIVSAGIELPEDLRIVYREIYREDVEAVGERDFEVRREGLQEMFERMGVDIDLSDLGPDMEDAEIGARIKAKLAQAGFGDEPAPKWSQASSSARSRRQQAKEAVEQAAVELRKKTLGSIYKQLAKVLHPDLELDPAERARKVTLMQELTVAYRAGDLHTLLRLEIEWLHRTEHAGTRLTEEKLAVFNTVLREQVQDLEREISRLPRDPRYHALGRSDGAFLVPQWTGAPAELRELEGALAQMEASLTRLREPRAVNEVKDLLAKWRAEQGS
jgi:exonuclease VII small subunit